VRVGCSAYGSFHCWSFFWCMIRVGVEVSAKNGLYQSIEGQTHFGMLEKVVLAMQVDTTWVREDLRIVHEVVENLADATAELAKVAAETEADRGKRSPSPSPWGPWPEYGGAEESDRARITDMLEEERVHLGEEEPNHIQRTGEALTAIETQMFDMNVGVEPNMTGLFDEDGDGGWHDKRAPMQATSSPTCKQARARDVEDDVDGGLQLTEATPIETRLRPHREGDFMWDDFMTTVRDVPSSDEAGVDAHIGWVSSKRVRGSPKVNRLGDKAHVPKVGKGGHGNLNLNLSPEGVGGEGGNTEMNERGTATGGTGGGRGTGRVKRPPAVQPRYTSTASYAQHMKFLCLIRSHAFCKCFCFALQYAFEVMQISLTTRFRHRTLSELVWFVGCCIPVVEQNQWRKG
jgi:hypothetical protein